MKNLKGAIVVPLFGEKAPAQHVEPQHKMVLVKDLPGKVNDTKAAKKPQHKVFKLTPVKSMLLLA